MYRIRLHLGASNVLAPEFRQLQRSLHLLHLLHCRKRRHRSNDSDTALRQGRVIHHKSRKSLQFLKHGIRVLVGSLVWCSDWECTRSRYLLPGRLGQAPFPGGFLGHGVPTLFVHDWAGYFPAESWNTNMEIVCFTVVVSRAVGPNPGSAAFIARAADFGAERDGEEVGEPPCAF